jgi:hypothetical protein
MNPISQNKMLSNIKMSELEFTDYKTALSKEGEIYLARDLNEKGIKDYCCCSTEQLRHYLDDDYNLYEILKEDKPRFSYIDFDCKYNSIRKFCEGKTDNEIKEELVSSVEGMYEDFMEEYGFTPYTSNCQVLDSSNKIKFSFHLCFDIRLKNQEESEVFHKKFINFCNERYTDDPEYHNIHKYIDPNVYTKNRLIRLPNQSKYGQDRPLKFFRGSKLLTDHILTAPNKKDFFVIPPPWIKRQQNKNRKINEIQTKTIEEYNEDDDSLWLIQNTGHKAENYEEWIKWVWACIGAGIPPEIIHRESYEACPEKYDEEGVNNIIKRYKEGKGLGKHSLIKWAAEKGRYLTREVEKKAKKLSENKGEHITWIDLQKKYHEKVFESFDELLEQIRDDVTQVINYIQGAQSVFTMYSNDENPFDLTKTLPYLILKYKEIQDVVSLGKTFQNEVIRQISLDKLLITNPLKFPLYNKLVFKPMDYGLRKNEKNTWIGFKAEKRDTYNMEPVNLFRKHIKEVLANNNEYNCKYIEKGFRTIMKTPWNKTGIFMLFYGEQGTGKTIVSEFLIKYVFGKHLSFSTNGIKPLTQRFNGCTMSKIFCCCNELSTINDSGNNWHSGFDSMKNLITDDLISIEKKGLEHIMIENYINFIGTTNNPNCIKVEKGDRRYACFEVSNKYKGDKKYFDNFVDVCMNDEAGNDIYNYYINTEDDDIDLRDIPETQFRKDLISNSRSPVERFIDELLNEEHNIDERKWLDKKKITLSNLYEEYCMWCGFNNEKCFSNNIFGKNIPKNKILEKGNTRIDKKMVRWILFN